jgi:hypothetical protein
MRNCRLSESELAELRAAHRGARHVRRAYRINAVILLGWGRSVIRVAEVLLRDQDTVRGYFKRYQSGGGGPLPALPGGRSLRTLG